MRALLLIALVILPGGCGARTGLLFPDGGADSDVAPRPAAGSFTIETQTLPEGDFFATGLVFWAETTPSPEAPSPWHGPWEGDTPSGAIALGPHCFYMEPAFYRFLSAGDVVLRDGKGQSRTFPATRAKIADDPSEYRYKPDFIPPFALEGLGKLQLTAPGDEIAGFVATVASAPAFEGTATLGASYSRTQGLSLAWQGLPPGAFVAVNVSRPFSGAAVRPSILCYFASPSSAGTAAMPALGDLFADATTFSLSASWIVLREQQLGALRLQIRRARQIYQTSSLPISP